MIIPNSAHEEARKEENVTKNRSDDILPGIEQHLSICMPIHCVMYMLLGVAQEYCHELKLFTLIGHT